MSIVYASTLEIATAIRIKDISAREVLEAYLAQIKKHNSTINAVVTLDADSARQRAKQADDALARGEIWGPLHGVPFTLKDCHSTAGLRTTAGFQPLENHIPQLDGTIAARLKAAGGIVMGKTNVSVMLADIQSDNPIFGRSNNPWNLDRTPGGSSGGAGAALATGMTPFEIGSDIGGSIRIPSHFCGVFGLKATENRISSYGHIPDPPGMTRAVRIIATLGPMARTVDDLALIYRLIAGPDGYDTEVQPVPVEDVPQIDLKQLRVAVAPNFPNFTVADDIRNAVLSLAEELASHCLTVEEAPLPPLDYVRSQLSEIDNMAIDAVDPEADKPAATLTQYLEALARRDEYIIAWEKFFSEWDVLLCPPAAVTAFPHRDTGTPMTVNGAEMPYWMSNAHAKLFNYTGHPALTMPYSFDRDGLPIGVQLVSKRWSESRLLGIGRAIAPITGTFERPPGF